MAPHHPSSRPATLGRIALCTLAVGAFVATPGATVLSVGVGFLVNTADANWSHLCGYLWRQPAIYTDPVDTALRESITEALAELEQSYRETPGVADLVASLFGRTDETQTRFAVIRAYLLTAIDQQVGESWLTVTGGRDLGNSRSETEQTLQAAIDAFFAVPSTDEPTQRIRDEIRLLLRENLARIVAERFTAKVNAPTDAGRALSDAISRLVQAVHLEELRHLALEFTKAQHNKSRMRLVPDLVWGTGHIDTDILIGEETRDERKEVDLSFDETAKAIFAQHKAIAIIGEGSSGKSYLAGRLLESLPPHTVVVMPFTGEAPPSLEFLRGQQTALFIDNFHETYQSLNPLAWLVALREVSDCYVVVVSRGGRRWDEVKDKTERSFLHHLSVHRGQSEQAWLTLTKLTDVEGQTIADKLDLDEDARKQWDGTIGSLRIDIAERGREYDWLASREVGAANGASILDAAKALHRLRQPVYPREMLRAVVRDVLVGSNVTNQQLQRIEALTTASGFGTFDSAGNFRVYEVFLERPDIITYDPADDLSQVAGIVLRNKRAETSFYLGVAAENDLHDTGLAIAAYEQSLALGHSWAASNLGLLRKQQGETDLAIAAFERSIALGEGGAAFNLGVLHYEQGMTDLAIAAWEQALALGYDQAAFNVGLSREQQGMTDLAIAAYIHGLAIGDGKAAHNLGALYNEQGKTNLAIFAYEQGIARGEGLSAQNLGLLRKQQGKTDLAIAAFEQGMILGVGVSAVNLGVLRERQGETDLAIVAFERGMTLGDDCSAHNLGVLRERQGETDLAIAAYEQGIALGHGAAAHNLGVLRERQGETDLAIAAYERGIALSYGGAAVNLGALCLEREESDLAIAAWEQGIALGEGRAAANLGALHERQGETDLAIAAYEQGIVLGDGKSALYLGVLHYQQERLEEAVSAWTRGAELGQPNCIDRLRQLSGDTLSDADEASDNSPS